MDIKGSSGEGSERREESYRESVYPLREYIYHHEQNVARNVKGKGSLGQLRWKGGTLVDTGGKVICVIKWQRTWLNYVLLLGGK